MIALPRPLAAWYYAGNNPHSDPEPVAVVALEASNDSKGARYMALDDNGHLLELPASSVRVVDDGVANALWQAREAMLGS